MSMKKYSKLMSLFLLMVSLPNYLFAEVENEKLNTIANNVQSLNDSELNKLAELIRNKNEVEVPLHIHKETIVKKKTILKKEKSIISSNENSDKMKKILTALGGLAAKEGTESACTFCSAILKDVTVNKVEVIDMSQDWIKLRIKKGNTLSYFANSYYGDANSYQRILDTNKNEISNDMIYEGKTLTLPRIETLEEQNKKESLSCKFCAALLSDSSLKNIKVLKVHRNWVEVQIKSGDTLSHLALKYYGKASAYVIIYNANIETIPKNYLLFPGDIVKVPTL